MPPQQAPHQDDHGAHYHLSHSNLVTRRADCAACTMAYHMEAIEAYFHKWHLILSIGKTVASAFHLNNRQAQHTLSVSLGERKLDHAHNPTYLGVTLDRSLSYRTHLEKLKKKVGTRVNPIRNVAGTKWKANTPTLRTSTLAQVYTCMRRPDTVLQSGVQARIRQS